MPGSADIRQFQTQHRVAFAYSLFNTFSLFVSNDELIQSLQCIRRSLLPDGRLMVQLGSIWSYLADGVFHNDTYERTDKRGSLIRKEKGLTRLARTNNVYERRREVQYTKDGVEFPARSERTTQRMLSPNEWDLLCRLTGFTLEARYTRTELASRVGDHEVYDGEDRDLNLILRRGDP